MKTLTSPPALRKRTLALAISGSLLCAPFASVSAANQQLEAVSGNHSESIRGPENGSNPEEIGACGEYFRFVDQRGNPLQGVSCMLVLESELESPVEGALDTNGCRQSDSSETSCAVRALITAPRPLME
jgi:hypothetical protein